MGMILTVVKTGLGLGVSIGTGSLVGCIVNKVLPSNSSKFTKVCVGLAGAVISGMAGKAVVEHFDNDFDETVENVTEIIDQIKNRNKELEEEKGA